MYTESSLLCNRKIICCITFDNFLVGLVVCELSIQVCVFMFDVYICQG